jgi:antitoxin ParD1/3/4
LILLRLSKIDNLKEEVNMPNSYSLGDYFERFIKAKVEAGQYSSASEVVREALRLLEEQDALRQLRTERIRRLVQESRDDPRPPRPAEEVFRDIRARIGEVARQRDGG